MELRNQSSQVAFGSCSELIDERFDQIAAGFAEFLGAAEISGVAFYEIWVELILANQEAESIAKARLTVTRPIPI